MRKRGERASNEDLHAKKVPFSLLVIRILHFSPVLTFLPISDALARGAGQAS